MPRSMWRSSRSICSTREINKCNTFLRQFGLFSKFVEQPILYYSVTLHDLLKFGIIYFLYFDLRHSTSRTLVSDDWNLYTKNAIEVRDSILALRLGGVTYFTTLIYIFPLKFGIIANIVLFCIMLYLRGLIFPLKFLFTFLIRHTSN